MNTQHKGSTDSGSALVLWLVWGSMLFSLLVIASVSLLIPPPPGFEPPRIAAGPFPTILIIFAVATAVLIPLLRRSRDRLFFKNLPSYTSQEEKNNAYFTMSLTTWVFCELVGVFGLIIAYLTFMPQFSLPFVLVAAILLGVYRPQSPRPKTKPL